MKTGGSPFHLARASRLFCILGGTFAEYRIATRIAKQKVPFYKCNKMDVGFRLIYSGVCTIIAAEWKAL